MAVITPQVGRDFHRPRYERVARELGRLLYATYRGWSADNATRLGASLAFYTLLSLTPMIIVVVAIAGAVFGKAMAEGRLVWQIRDMVGDQGAFVIQNLIERAHAPGRGFVATLFGVIALFFGATAVVNELRDALNVIWRVPPRDRGYWQTLVKMMRQRILAFAVVVGAGVLLLTSMLVNALLAAMGKYFAGTLPMPAWSLQLQDSVASFVLVTFIFGLLYKILPEVTLEWRDVVVGAMVTSILFTVGKLAIGIYLGRAGFAGAYGAAGSLVLFLIWVYYSAQIFFFGAEFTRVFTHEYGSVFRQRLALEAQQPRVEANLALSEDEGGKHETNRGRLVQPTR